MRKMILAAAMALALAGCDLTTSVLQGGGSLTATVQNPVGSVDIYRVKQGYAAAMELVLDYRRYCWARPYAVLMADEFAKPICRHRRQVVRTAQSARVKAATSIKVADDFVRANPTLSAVSVLGAAWNAVSAFQASVPAVK